MNRRVHIIKRKLIRWYLKIDLMKLLFLVPQIHFCIYISKDTFFKF
jgi:hypothetical protein